MAARARISVLGAGLMGHGIAQVFALAGHEVAIYDPVAASLDQVRTRIVANLRDLGDEETAVERVHPCTDLAEAVRDADFVVEAAPEDLAIKQALFQQVERHVRPDTILASNTSVIPITSIMQGLHERSTTVRKGFISRVPKGRLGEPSDLAGPLLFLASKASDFYTGHILYADGGYTAG